MSIAVLGGFDGLNVGIVKRRTNLTFVPFIKQEEQSLKDKVMLFVC